MGNINGQGDLPTSVETAVLAKLTQLATSGAFQAIQKTSTGFANIDVPQLSGVTNSLAYWNSTTTLGSVTLGTGIALSGGVLTATGLGGTVTSVSVVTANGISASITAATTTPAITFTLGAITPTSVNGLTVTTTTGTLTVTNAKTLSVSNTLTFTGTDSSSIAFGTGGTVAYLASPAFTGSPTAPTQAYGTSDTTLATTAFVQNALVALDSKPAVDYASTSALPANTYNNQASGVGATLTGNANGPLIIDGVTILIGQVGRRVLVAAESASANNGWYTITQQGTVAVSPYILTRATESDQAAEIGAGYLTSVTAPNTVTPGSANNGKVFISVAADPFTVGTTALTFSQVGGTYTNGNGLSLSGSTFSINTAVTADLSTVQTFTNKTLTSPNINEAVALTTTATKLNYLTSAGGTTGTASTNVVFSTNPTLSGLTFADATNIVINATTGTKIGTATTQKIGFFNSTPIVQPTGDVITALQNLGLGASLTVLATTITSRTIWGQTYDGSGNVSGSLTAVANITGGASSMTITAGTGNSRTLALQSTTSGGTATTFLTGDASQNVTLAGNLTLGASTSTITGAAGNMTIVAGTGNSRTLILQTTTSGGTATTALTLNADQTATFAAAVSIGTGNAFTCGTIELGAASDTTLGRVSAGVISVEGITIATSSNTLTLTNKSIVASQITTGTFGTGAYTMDTSLAVPQIFNADNLVTLSSNAATITRANRNNVLTNNSAANMTITLSTTGAVGGDMLLIQILDFSAVAKTIAWVNTENSTVTATTTSNGSTTLPVTIGFKWNVQTSKWRCIAAC